MISPLSMHMQEDWEEGVARLLNPPLDLLQLVVRDIEANSGLGILVVPKRSAQA